MYVLNTDDSILAAPCQQDIDAAITGIKNAGLQITVDGTLAEFLGIKITRHDNGSFEMTQEHLTDQIIKENFVRNAKPAQTPANSSSTLKRHPTAPPFNKAFKYRSIIGKLNYLVGGLQPDVSYIAHQCVWFPETPKAPHGIAVWQLAKYLKGTK